MKSLKDRLWHYAEHELLHWHEADADETGAYKYCADLIIKRVTRRHRPITKLRVQNMVFEIRNLTHYTHVDKPERKPYYAEVAERVQAILDGYSVDAEAEKERRAQRQVEAGR